LSKLAETYLHLDINLDEKDKSQLKDYLLSKAPTYSQGIFKQELEFAVYVEDGSLKIWLAAAGMLYAGIAGYGSFRSGIDYLVKDAREVSERLFEDVKQAGVSQDQVVNFQRRLGVPGQIKRVLRDIRKLEKNGRDFSKHDYEILVNSVKNRLERISKKLDHEEDLYLLHKNIPKTLSDSLPRNLPSPDKEKARLIALRPEEYDSSFYVPSNALTLGTDTDNYNDLWSSDSYVVKETSNGIRLLPRVK
jgi:hypothetical protein